MLEEYSFHTKQINYLRNALAQVPGFLPDGKTLAQVDTLLGTREQPRKDYLAKHTALTTARGEVHEAQATGHKTAVAVYGLMKSIYRNLPAKLESIQRVPAWARVSAAMRTVSGMTRHGAPGCAATGSCAAGTRN